jgi:amino acid adenylation domain-containing protein/FkbH-like protein/thioester reductase-like protein
MNETRGRMDLEQGFSPAAKGSSADRGSAPVEDARPVVVAATFTADLLHSPLQFWMETLGIASDITLAPYGQVLQELLDPQSVLAQNQSGFSIVLLRLEDWIRDRLEEDVPRNVNHLRRTARDVVAAVGSLRGRTSVPILMFLCPPSSSLPAPYRDAIAEIQRDLLTELGESAGVHCWNHADLMRLYPVTAYEDPRADRIGHIPYTTEYFVALGTLFARRIAALLKPQCKVIAVDCDNTLWKGICGEDGVHGIELTEAHFAFQRMLVGQHDAGVLLCLCSKNNEGDVAAVFKGYPQMPLREEHLISSRVNWRPKSESLLSLAQELDLSIDSFMLIDDSPLECEEVRARCPGILALQFPQTADEIKHFLDHTWAFDRTAVTQEAKQRTAQYRRNRERRQALSQASDLKQFLASLELKVDVAEMQPEQLSRVAELIQRTNQFNLTANRRSYAEIDALWKSGEMRILTTYVRDRFGDYGLVGAVFYRRAPSSIDVDTFVLSCRALGRGVEHRIINELGRIGRREGAANVVLSYRATPRNVPAWNFLERSFIEFRELSRKNGEGRADCSFTFPVEYAENLGNESAVVVEGEGSVSTSSVGMVASRASVSDRWHEAAYQLSRIDDIVQRISRSAPRARPQEVGYIAAATAAEAAVAQIWAEILGIDAVDVEADFFNLGGDSILAVQVIARIESALRLSLSLYDFLEGPTVREVAAKLAEASDSEAPIGPADRGRSLALSPAQQRLWFIDQLEGGRAAYHIPLAMRMKGELNCVALQSALDGLIQRHETLRTTFVNIDGEPIQQIAENGHFALLLVDLSHHEVGKREVEVLKQSHEEFGAAFDLATGPLVRGRLLKLSKDEHVLLITMHHIVSDGWSIGVLIRDLGALYEAFMAGVSSSLAPLPIQYADYALWQREQLDGASQREHLPYWAEHLRGAPELLELPTDRPRPPVQSYRGANVPVALGHELTAELKAFAREHNLTIAMVLCAAWSIVLARLSGQDDVVIGMPVANRRRTELEGLIGFFVNTLAVRIRLDGDPSVADLLRKTKEIMLGAYAHQDVPFERVVETLQPVRTLSYSAIFQVLLVVHNTPRDDLRLPGLILAQQDVPSQASHFDVTLSLQETTEGVCGALNYASDLFDASTIARWAHCFGMVLRHVMRQTGESISRLPMMSPEERRRVVEDFNQTRADFPHEKLIGELFEEQVARSPEAIAVVSEDRSLTYGELNARANQLARHLNGMGVGPDQLVALCVERGIEMLVGLLGILKAGAAYVPLDPSNPSQRLEDILRDARPQLVLTQERLKWMLPGVSVGAIALDADWETIAQHSKENFSVRSLGMTARHLAYVIYTSGSTGKPKGVMVEHRSVVNYALHIVRQFDVASGGGSLVCTSISFDLMLTGLYPTLLCGRTVRLCREQRGVPALVDELLLSSDLAPLKLTPSHLALLEQPLRSGKLDGRVRVLVLGGESLQADALQLWRKHAPSTRIFNHYGPTETTVGSVTNEVGDHASGAVPIGRPIANTRVYILDRHGQPVPIGVVGEIHIGGAGVARGYLNRQELTAERFLQDVYSNDAGARMYRTGDLGRWRSDGKIECLGRNDHQVKLRGFRIELGEIEAQLVRHEQVSAAVVIAREDIAGEKRLVAYVVRASDPGPTVEALRAHLTCSLPEYMVPSAFVVLEALPLTPNGKLDRRALPAPELGAYVTRQYEAPRGEMEEVLAGVWQQLLRIDRVGRNDNFFELGGHSLLIVQMLDRLRRVGLSTELRRVFESPTLADLASVLANEVIEKVEVPISRIPPACPAITPDMLPLLTLEQKHIDWIVKSVPGGASNIQDIYPLAPLQEGILFHHLLNEEAWDPYVSPIVLAVSSRQRLDELIAAISVVIERHDVLRTAVLWEELPRAVQVVYRRVTVPVTQTVLDPDRDPIEQVKSWGRPERQQMDLRQAPLLRLQIAADPRSEQWYALLQRQHVISDHVTLELVIAEVVEILQGRAAALPKPAQYRDHVAQALAYARNHDAEKFFHSKLATIDEPTAPFGLVNVHGDGSQIEEAREDLGPGIAQRVRIQARRLGVSAATLFHAAWALVVAHTSGRDDVVFGSVLLGRLQGSTGAQRTLGMFINTLPLRLQLQGGSAIQLVELVQRELVELLGHEQASLAVAQRCSGIAARAPLFSTLFNYRHSTSSTALQWSGASGIRELVCDERTNYPITLSVDDYGTGFSLKAQTDRQIDPRRITEYMKTAVESLTQALELSPQTLALELPILPDVERSQVLEVFNETRADIPSDKLIHELFEEQVRRTPQAVAVVCEERSHTYAQLNAKANQLARYLRRKGIGPDRLAAVCVERSLEMVVALLGVLKAGGAYVPLDTSYPAERLRYMLRDIAPAVLLTQARFKGGLPKVDAPVIILDAECDEIWSESSTDLDAAEIDVTRENLAYVIYTSGSTGAPKGVMVEHLNLVNFIHWHCAAFDIGQGSRCASAAAIGFDAAVWEIWPTLSSGATVVLAPPSVTSDPEVLLSWLGGQPLDLAFLTTAIAEFAFGRNVLGANLRTLLVGGDTLRHRPKSEAFTLFNNYGPTETTIAATSGKIERTDTVLHIGRPIANVRIYILNGRRQPVPVGVSGEIYIGGAGVGRGYLNRPELTAERFVSDLFGSDPRARMYKTGDMARWRGDGTIEFLGRNDNQLKIRGFRIELGEIEAQLACHEQVKDAVVVAREDIPGEKRLVAYVVPDDCSRPPSVESVRAHLTGVLPEYMVPSAFVVLQSLPLTPNGKLDRRALPKPELEAYSRRRYESPEGETEQALAGIWQDLLHVDRVGREDDFFELGGHSLLVLRLVANTNQTLGCALRVADVYKSSTLKELARRVRGDTTEDAVISLPAEAALDAGILRKPALRRAVPADAVLLTGATGFVGRFLLAQLLRDTHATVYCLVRAPGQFQAASRMRETLVNWGLWRDDLENRVVSIPGDLRLSRFGLDDATYKELSQNIDSIYHCGTSMNHLETYAMAKQANVESARELLKLATKHKLKLINYISTAGVFSSYTSSSIRVVDEATVIDYEIHRNSRGYIASKWVGEKVFLSACDKDVPCNVFRLGLVWADTEQGRFDELQTAYRMLKSCLISGCAIEGYRYHMAPTPVDYVARAVVSLADRHPSGHGIFHIASPAQMIDGVFERCNEIAGTSLTLLPYYDWIRTMQRLHKQGWALPIVPLIEYAFTMDETSFYEHLRGQRAENVHFDSARTCHELEARGIVAPMFNDELLKVCLDDMMRRDAQLRELFDSETSLTFARQGTDLRLSRSMNVAG